MIFGQGQILRPLTLSRRPELGDIVRLARRFPQRDAHGQPRWIFTGGAAAKLFSERFEIRSLDGKKRERIRGRAVERSCKDLDVCILDRDDPFLRPGRLRHLPFFRRYDVHPNPEDDDDFFLLETTRGWHFYTFPPSREDVVQAVVSSTPILCASPEYLAASFLKAILEGRASSIEDAFTAFSTFADFRDDSFLIHAQRAPVSAALTAETLAQLIPALYPDQRPRIRAIALASLRDYYSETFGVGSVLACMNENTIRFLAAGVGVMGTPTPEERAVLPPIESSERSFWDAIYSRFGISSSAAGQLIETIASQVRDEEIRIVNLVAVAATLEQLKELKEAVLGRGAPPSRVVAVVEQLAAFILSEFQKEPDVQMQPLRATFYGILQNAKARLETSPAEGIAFFYDGLLDVMHHLARDTQKERKLQVR